MPSASAGDGRSAAASRLLVLSAAFLAVVLWAGTVVVTKVTVAEADALAVGFLRTLLAGLVALPLALASLARRPRGGAAWRGLGAASLGAYVLFPILFSLGMARTSGAHTALIMASLPILTGLIAAPFEGRWPSRRWCLASAVAFAGTLWLTAGRDAGAPGGASLAGDLLVLASCLAAAFGYVTGARASRGSDAWQVTLWGLILASLLLLPFLGLVPLAGLLQASAGTWLGVAYLGLVSSLLGYALWYWALASGGIARTGTFQFLQPLIALALTGVLLGEALEPRLLLAGAIILTGVWFAQSDTRPATSEPKETPT